MLKGNIYPIYAQSFSILIILERITSYQIKMKKLAVKGFSSFSMLSIFRYTQPAQAFYQARLPTCNWAK
jgi:hypothetical protein